MSARVLPAELAAVRALVADGLAEIGDAGDTGQVWIRSATARLTALDGVLTEAAGVLAAPTQVLVVTLATFLVVAGSAALAGALGLSSGGILAVTGTALLIMFTVTPWAGRRLYTRIGRRRLALAAAHLPPLPGRPAPPHTGPTDRTAPGPEVPLPTQSRRRLPSDAPASTADGVPGFLEAGLSGTPQGRPAGSPEAGLSGASDARSDGMSEAGLFGAGLAGVPERLLVARVRLVSAALRQVGAGRWSAPELRRAIRADPVVRRLARADQLLCQAVDCVERHLGDLRKDTL